MLRVNMYAFYDLGSRLKSALSLADNARYRDAWYGLYQARDALQVLLDSEIVPVKTCRVAAEEAVAAINQAVPLGFAEATANIDKQESVPQWVVIRIRSRIRDLQTILSAELNVLDTYSVSQKGAYSTSDLIQQAELLIPESLRGLLPVQSKLDIQQAGKCIAYDVPTGAAFHILRGTEAVIRAYYQHVTGTLPKPKMRNWGAYVKHLITSGADPKITGYIDHLRELYRNPVFHPEENLSPEEAQMFLGACISAICQMLIAIRDTPAKLAPGVLATPAIAGVGMLGPLLGGPVAVLPTVGDDDVPF